MDEIHKLLWRIGLRPNYVGYHYLAFAIKLVTEDETYLFNVTKRLYPEIASHSGTKVKNVERAIRSLITNYWDQFGGSYLSHLFGCPIVTKPYTREFIAILANILKLNTYV